jgi:hypothetical protein
MSEPDLKTTAEQFARDLLAANIAGLSMAMTPSGLMKAMALQAQRAASGQNRTASGFEVHITGREADDELVDLVLKSEEGDAVLGTRWRLVMGDWKLDDIALKSS